MWTYLEKPFKMVCRSRSHEKIWFLSFYVFGNLIYISSSSVWFSYVVSFIHLITSLLFPGTDMSISFPWSYNPFEGSVRGYRSVERKETKHFKVKSKG